MDERLPLLRDSKPRPSPSEPAQYPYIKSDVVDFDQNGDSEDPTQWQAAYKWTIVVLLACMAFATTFTCLSVVPVAGRIVRDLEQDDRPHKSASVLLVTIWELGEAAGPLFIGPLSEIFGRYKTFNAANIIFICTTVFAACCQSTNFFIAARAMTGLAVAANVLNPAIVGDIFCSDQRGSAMSVIMLAPLVGAATGPVVAGAIAEALGWRQVLWIAAALASACEIVFLCCFRETYKVVILRRRASDLRRTTGNANIKTIFEIDEKAQNSKHTFWTSIVKPFAILFSSPVLQAICLFGGVSYTTVYIMSTSLPDILQDYYGLSQSMTGVCFMAFSAGCLITVSLCNVGLDRIYVRLRDANQGIEKPEYRLPLVIVGALMMPGVLALYGWCVQLHLPLSVFLVSVGLIGATMMLSYVPLMAYVVDALGLYSASGMTAVIVTRCLMGTFLPLTTGPLVSLFDYGFAFTIQGGVTLALAPIPILVFRYGYHWRQRSEYTRAD